MPVNGAVPQLVRAGTGETIGARPILEFAAVRGIRSRGARLEAIRTAAVAYGARLHGGGQVRALRTSLIAGAGYPTRFVLGGAAIAPTVPYVLLASRLLIVEYEDFGGVPRTLLWEPTIPEGAAEAPFNAQLEDRVSRLPGGRYLAHNVVRRDPASLAEALGAAGVDHAAVDYVSFGHLQGQDPRLLIGTTEPWADEPEPRAPLFANARLIVQRREAAAFAGVHPVQWAWYVDGGMESVVEESVVLVDGDLELGVGVSLLATPGCTDGHQTLVLDTPDGVWIASHNGVALDNWQPQMSKIPGVRAHADFFNREVVPNSNGSGDPLDQYDSMIIEKTLASPSRADPCWLQILPARELAAPRRQWPVLPSHAHDDVSYGMLSRRPPTGPPA